MHSFRWVVDREATADEKGSRHEECEICGYKRPEVEIPAAGDEADPAQPDNPGGSEQPAQPDHSGGSAEANPNPNTVAGDRPKTGDSSNVLLWMVLLAVSGCGAAGAVVYWRRKKVR